jgi:DNA topoisomerase-3
VQNFKPETFWGIKVIISREGKKVNFLWKRVHLFDRAVVTMMLERCLVAKQAKVTKVNQKPTSKWRPLPLTTVDLQMMGSRFLRLDSQTIMKVCQIPSKLKISSLTGLTGCGSALHQRIHQLPQN